MFANLAQAADQARADLDHAAKAKDLRPVVEKLVTLAKRGDLHARRQVLSQLRDVSLTEKLFSTLAERYKTRKGAIPRLESRFRYGDKAPMAIIEFVDRDPEAKGKDSGRCGSRSPGSQESACQGRAQGQGKKSRRRLSPKGLLKRKKRVKKQPQGLLFY